MGKDVEDFIKWVELLERLYGDIQHRQVKAAGVISKSGFPDLRNHHIGMFSAYSEVLNLLDEEMSKCGEKDA